MENKQESERTQVINTNQPLVRVGLPIISQIIADAQTRSSQNQNTTSEHDISNAVFFETSYDEDIDLSIYDECGSIGTIEDVVDEPICKKQKSEKSEQQSQPRITATPEQRQRIKFLMEVPSLVARIVNSGDDEGLKALIYDACVEDCRCKISSIPNDLIGRDYILKSLAATVNTFPDYIMQYKAPTVRQRTITAALETSGTRVVVDPNSHLFDHLRYGNTSNVSFVRAQQLVEEIESSGKRAAFKSKSMLHIVINKEMTHIECWVSIRKSIGVMAAKDIPDL